MAADASSGFGASMLKLPQKLFYFPYRFSQRTGIVCNFYQGDVWKKEKQPKLYKYLFATSKGVHGRIKCFVLDIFFFFLTYFNYFNRLLSACLSPNGDLIHTKHQAKKPWYFVCYTKWHLQMLFSCSHVGYDSALMLKYELAIHFKILQNDFSYTASQNLLSIVYLFHIFVLIFSNLIVISHSS